MSKFQTARSDKTQVDYNLLPDGKPNYNQGSISQYKPNVFDKIGDALPDTGPVGVLKGLYKGTDDTLFGLLPSGKYGGTPTKEKDLGNLLSYVTDPYGIGKSAKMAVSGVKIGNKTYGTPIGKLIANSVSPVGYDSKWGAIKRTLTNKEVFKDAVLKDMPQYRITDSHYGNDRLFAWRKKFGLGKPNRDYNRILDPVGEMQNKAAKETLSDLTTKIPSKYHKKIGTYNELVEKVNNYESPLDKIWNKFGKHTEDGKEYFHYKNPSDYFDQIKMTNEGKSYHNLFGNYSKVKKTKWKNNKTTFKHHYYDDWDFGLNRGLGETLSEMNKNTGLEHGLLSRIKGNLPTIAQRILGDALTRDVVFKGTAKQVKPLPSPLPF